MQVPSQQTVRQVVTENIARRFPYFRSRTDFETLLLATSTEDIAPSQAQKWVVDEIQRQIERGADLAASEARATELLNMRAEVSGRKPKPEEDNVTILPIPGTSQVIRLWPGSRTRLEYNLDFLDTKTGAAITIPDGYILVHLPPKGAYLPQRRLLSLTETFRQCGWPVLDRTGGTYVLRDGLTFALRVAVCIRQILYDITVGDR
ncbi:hypothetical protein LXA43DRAFT_1099867 [Ganoderma leucocontextum]|nr:hypothetical protein LXA43DRAFT_1099867 [Ganoderma leucocontextum]